MRLLTLLFAMAIVAGAQTVEFKNAPGRDDLQIGYNRFEDESLLITKRSVVTGATGKSSVLNPNSNARSVELALAVAWKGTAAAAPATVTLGIFPELSTRMGSFVAKMEGERLYIAPESKVIAIADGTRVDLGSAAKSATLNALGHYSGAAGVSIPIGTLRTMLAAKKLELAVGSIELKLSKQFIQRGRELLTEIDSRWPQR